MYPEGTAEYESATIRVFPAKAKEQITLMPSSRSASNAGAVATSKGSALAHLALLHARETLQAGGGKHPSTTVGPGRQQARSGFLFFAG